MARRLLDWWLVVALAACSRAAAPGAVVYDLVGPRKPAKSGALGPGTTNRPVIGVTVFDAVAAYQTEQIARRSGSARLDYYNYHRWVSPVPVLIGELIISQWQSMPLFQRVDTDALATDLDLVVTGRVLAAEENRLGERSVARVVLELTARNRAGKVVFSRQLVDETPVLRPTVDALVVAMRESVVSLARRFAPAIAAAARSSRNAAKESP